MRNMHRIDTELSVLKQSNHYDTYLEYLSTESGAKDWMEIIFRKTEKSGRKDFKKTIKTSVEIDTRSIGKLLTLEDFQNNHSSFVANLISSSLQYFLASDYVNFLVKPVLLFYGIEHLTAAAVYSRYKILKRTESHGLSQSGASEIFHIQKKGLFPLFLCSHQGILLLPGNEINYKVLLKWFFEFSRQSIGPMKDLADRLYKEDSPPFQDYKDSSIDELSLHYLLMFYFSSLSRYQINYWKKKLSDKKQESFLIKKFLNFSRDSFPTYLFYKCFLD